MSEAWRGNESIRDEFRIEHDDTTDARPPTYDGTRLVVLGGAIKWWWLARCLNCDFCDEPHKAESDCLHSLSHGGLGFHDLYVHWNSPEHREYITWRNHVRKLLVANNFLTYAPHEAFKGTWVEAAQEVNDVVIASAHVFLVMSPANTITDGTDSEIEYAQQAHINTPVVWAPPGTEDRSILAGIDAVTG